MPNTHGMLTLDELSSRVGTGEIDTVLTVFTDLYGRFLGKRIDAGFFLEDTAAHGTHACDYLLTVDMERESSPDSNTPTGSAAAATSIWFRTSPHCVWPVGSTALRWSCAISRTRVRAQAPHSILRKQILAATEMGCTPKAGSELEYFLVQTP